ncbi:phosphoglycolate phosphatase [Sphingobium sufflavum]|uniref:phosphoglycolate phosphatase n=1 Tax=Sphingobium sufflavum TaxID=1129547 RepID=UPI001EEB205F|nr:phosphoglycolate phosphatase [Sphingobium sufflavum]MCE7795838.1 phosphoglycolate phosphatase [Sphingobium sufflavum]
MTVRPFDLIGFDLDGTLLDTSGDLAMALNHALGTIGRNPLPVTDVQKMVGRGARIMLARALAATGDAPQTLIDQLYPIVIAHYEAHIADLSRPYPGVVAALEGLSARGYRLAVCTNKIERLARLVLAELGMAHHFVAIVGGDTTPQLKPDPAPLLAMIDTAGGGRTLFVGDSDNDILAARAAGVASVAVSFGYVEGDPAELGADALIQEFGELVPLVEEWTNR